MVIDVKRRLRTKASAFEKLAITLPRELAEAVRREAQASRAPSLSAYFAQKMAEAVERDRLLEILDKMDAEHGPPSPEATAWANEVLFGE